ncbi:MAG: Uma2 family endonuclease [Chloroflexi bacterium]|nr:Uma2 family endonuclease [Chloroflexota bacterium]OJV97110.1 MAG: hypothetical protein BGO39_19155 [Chloroflexi bacterium 54-19]
MTTRTNHIERYYDSHEVEGAELTQSVDHYLVIQYLIVVLQWIFQGKGIGVVSNVNFYQTANPRETPISPDIAVVEGLPENRKPEDKSSYYVGETSPAPRVVFEIASKETWRQDLEEKPARYSAMGVSEYFVYAPNEQTVWTRQWRAHNRLIGWHRNAASGEFELVKKDANDHLWSEELASWLVVEPAGLRLYDANGQLRLTESEALQQNLAAERSRAEAERHRANLADLQKQKLAEKLKELGINPEELL